MSTPLTRIIGLGIVIGFIILTALFITQKSYGSAPSGLMARVATTTNPTVSTTAVTVFATSTCSSRTITTSGQPIMITFSDYNGATPTGSFGHLQAASTTVAYDSGQYGCGLTKIYSFASQVLTVTESW